MVNFVIKVAGRTVGINAMFPDTKDFCADYLCDETPEFSVSVNPEDITFERDKSNREDQLEGKPIHEFTDTYLETISIQRKITEHLFDYDTLLFHGSVIAVDGVGYLFTAKSGTGKSTHTRFWRQLLGERAVMVNDDKPFLQITPKGVLAHGSPWNGKHGLGTNISVPLKAICILERGPGNRIRQIPAKEAVFMLLQQSNRPMQPRLMPKYLEMLDRLSAGVSLYCMQCNRNPNAARVSYEAMSAEE